MRNTYLSTGSMMTSLIALGALLLPLSGCATMTNGQTQEIPVSSAPTGATVLVDDIRMGETPCTVRLERKANHTVVLQAQGYRPETRYITRKPSGAVRGNIWLGGLVGWAVDAATGADNNLVPDQVHVVLERENPAPNPKSDDVVSNSLAPRTKQEDARQAASGM